MSWAVYLEVWHPQDNCFTFWIISESIYFDAVFVDIKIRVITTMFVSRPAGRQHRFVPIAPRMEVRPLISYWSPWQSRCCVFVRRHQSSRRGIVAWTSRRPAAAPRRMQHRRRSRQVATHTPSTWQPSLRRLSLSAGSTPTPRRQCWRASAAARVSLLRWAWRVWCGTDPARVAELRRAGSSPPVARRRRRRRRPTPSRWTALWLTTCSQSQLVWRRFAERPSIDRYTPVDHQMVCSIVHPRCRMTSRDHSNSRIRRCCIPLLSNDKRCYTLTLPILIQTRNSSGDEIPERDMGSYTFFLRLTPPTEGFPWDDFRKILHGGKRMATVQNGEEILPKVSSPWVGRRNVTDDRRICDSKDPNVT